MPTFSSGSSIRFDVATEDPVSRATSGDGIQFRVDGASDATSSLRIAGTPFPLSPDETPLAVAPAADGGGKRLASSHASANGKRRGGDDATSATTASIDFDVAFDEIEADAAAASETAVFSKEPSPLTSGNGSPQTAPSTTKERRSPPCEPAGSTGAVREEARLSTSQVSSERQREIVENGGPTSRGLHSLNRLAPDARKDPPDVPGPPRYLRSQGVTPVHSARSRSSRPSQADPVQGSHGDDAHAARSTAPVAEATDSKAKAKKRHRKKSQQAAQKTKYGHDTPRSSGASTRDRSEPHEEDVDEPQRYRQTSRAAQRHASILAPEYAEDDLTGTSDMAPLGGGHLQDFTFPPVPALPRSRFSEVAPLSEEERSRRPSLASVAPNSTASRGSAVASGVSPLSARQPPPRSHSAGRSGDAVPDTHRPTLSSTRPPVPSSRMPMAATKVNDSHTNAYAKPRLMEQEEEERHVNVGGPSRYTARGNGAPQPRLHRGDGGSAPSLSSFLSDIKRSPTSLAYQRNSRDGDRNDSLPDGGAISSLFTPSGEQGVTQAAGRPGEQPASFSGVLPPKALPWDETKLPHPGEGSHGASVSDPWELEMARRALEQYPPLTTTTGASGTTEQDNDMTALLVVVKHLPSSASTSVEGEDNPCIVRVFIPTEQLPNVTMSHLKLELHRQLGVPAEYQDIRTEGVRLLDELPLQLLDPTMVLFADVSAAPAEVVEAERQQILQQQQQKHKVDLSSSGPPQDVNASHRSSDTEVIFKRGSRKARSPHSSPQAACERDVQGAANDDAVSEHIRRLCDLLGLEEAELSPTPKRRPPPPPPSAPVEERVKPRLAPSSPSASWSSSSTSDSSKDSLSASSITPPSDPRYRSRKSSAPFPGPAPLSKHALTDGLSGDGILRDVLGVSRSAVTSPSMVDPAFPVPYSTAHFSTDSPRTSLKARAAAPPHRRSGTSDIDRRRHADPRVGSTGPAPLSGQKPTGVVFMGSVVRPFKLNRSPVRGDGKDERATDAEARTAETSAHTGMDPSSHRSPKQTTLTAAKGLPVPTLRYYHRGTNLTAPIAASSHTRVPSLPSASTRDSHPTGMGHDIAPEGPDASPDADADGEARAALYPDALVAYPMHVSPTPSLAAALQGSLGVPEMQRRPSSSGANGNDLVMSNPNTYPYVNAATTQSIATAAAVQQQQSRERMRQALALETAQDALRFAASARAQLHHQPVHGAMEGRMVTPTPETWSLTDNPRASFAKPFQMHNVNASSATPAPAPSQRVDAMEYPVPEEGGVSPSEFSTIDRHSIRSLVADDEEEMALQRASAGGRHRTSARPVYAGITEVDPSVAGQLLSQLDAL